jgi:hypothetical protein
MMRVAVNKTVVAILLFPFLVPVLASDQTGASTQPAETPTAFVERIQGLLGSGNLSAYLQVFEPGIRTAEETRLRALFDELQPSEVSLRTAGVQTDRGGAVRVFVQAFFENAHMEVIESWTLALEKVGSTWSVVRLNLAGNPTRLYKIHVPSERAERAGWVEITHADVRFTFADAAVFYDDVPGLETALVVVGRGKVVFSPADPNEKHQLELLYKKNLIEDDIESLYVRCSPGFFASNVRVGTGAGLPAVSAAERDRASAVFSRSYPRSFTIESSHGESLLSLLPQGDEAVLDFKGRRIGELSYIYYPFSDDKVSIYDYAKERIVCLYSPDPAPDPSAKRMFISFKEKFDVRSYALEISYSPASSYLSAKARIGIVPNVDLLDSLKFRFNPELEILKITDEENRELFYTKDKLRKFLYVYLVSPPAPRAPTSITIVYRGRMRPAPPSTDVVSQAVANQSVRFRKPRYETYFFSHAGFWYPSPAEEDYFEARLTIVIPPEYDCVANGEMVAKDQRKDLDDVVEIEKAGSSVYTFSSRSPVKYLSFIVGKFDQKTERETPVPVAIHISSEILDSRPEIAGQAADILDFYGQAFGPFPYGKLGIVLRLWPVFGGHSPASFIVINEVPWLGDSGFSVPADTPVDLSAWEDYFLAHEIAHQWWGQGVSFESYKDQWLSEGLAQFAAASYLRHKYGESAFAAILKKFARWTEKKSFRGPIIMGSRLSYYDFEAYQAIVYNKAALAVFMLQDLLGRETFEAGLRAFFEKHKFHAARTGEFIAAMQSASGRDLKAFFRGWFFEWDLPEVQATWTETPVVEGVRLDFRVTQVKGRFVFPLWIEWTLPGGETGRTKIVVDEATSEASVTLPRKPAKVRVNPDKAVPGRFT